jgi:phage terminase large subunit-like protein
VNYRREFAAGDTTADVEFSGLPGSDFIVEGVGIPAHTYSGKLGITFVPLLGQATVIYEFKVSPGQRRQTAGFRMRF